MIKLATVQGSLPEPYQVYFEDKVKCTCPHYSYRLIHTKQTCKHIQRALNELHVLCGLDLERIKAYSGPEIFINMLE